MNTLNLEKNGIGPIGAEALAEALEPRQEALRALAQGAEDGAGPGAVGDHPAVEEGAQQARHHGLEGHVQRHPLPHGLGRSGEQPNDAPRRGPEASATRTAQGAASGGSRELCPPLAKVRGKAGVRPPCSSRGIVRACVILTKEVARLERPSEEQK